MFSPSQWAGSADSRNSFMYWLTENSFPIAMIGLLFTGAAIGFGLILPHQKLFRAGIGFAILTIALIAVEQWIVTDREQLNMTVRDMARAVRRNNLDELLAHVSTSARGPVGATRNRIRSEMPDYYFRACRLGPVDIELEPGGDKAKVTFVAIVDVDASRRYGYDGVARRRVFLDFEKDADGEWKVTFFDHADPATGLRL